MKFNNTINQNDCLTLYDVFSLFSLFATSALIAFSVTGWTIYKRADDDWEWEYNSEEEEGDADAEDVEYDELYYSEFDKLEERVLEKEDLEKLGNVVVREKTPNGEVIMTYNSNTESFWYYCDDKNVKYTVLDTVARKFAIDNNCKCICVNYKAEFEKAKVAIMADQITSNVTASASTSVADSSVSASTSVADTQPAVVKRSIYAKFKNYKSGNATSVAANATSTANNSSDKTKIYILTEKANRFTYKGRVSNYKEPNTVEVTDTVYKKVIDFATFKKSLLEKQE
jgi:hypothetical protein